MKIETEEIKAGLNMSDKTISVLLIEDNPGDANLIKEYLSEATNPEFRLECLNSLDALRRMKERDFSVLLLDLSLPDTIGVETLIQAHAIVSDIPIVVLTGREDISLGLQTVKLGAQDYLLKGEVDSKLLARALQYAIERQRLTTELEASRRRETEAREIQTLELLSHGAPSPVTAEMFGLLPIRYSAPQVFADLVSRYNKALDWALEEHHYRVKRDVTGLLQTMANEMGQLKAGPRDVVELHTNTLHTKTDQLPAAKAQAYVQEGRILVLQLMGYLVLYYRNLAVMRNTATN